VTSEGVTAPSWELLPGGSVLLVRGSGKGSQSLALALAEGGFTPVHATTVVGALRELHLRSYVLVVTDTTLQRDHDSLKLVDLLLGTQMVAGAAQVVVLTSERDPAVMRYCLKAGVVDYILEPAEAPLVLQRLLRALERPDLDNRLVRVATPLLGPATRVLVQRVIKAYLEAHGLSELRREHLPELLMRVSSAAQPVLRDGATVLMRLLLQSFNVQRAASP
jgi:CheY-like chemotaxis protein